MSTLTKAELKGQEGLASGAPKIKQERDNPTAHPQLPGIIKRTLKDPADFLVF